jgi:hypothetical protein
MGLCICLDAPFLPATRSSESPEQTNLNHAVLIPQIAVRIFTPGSHLAGPEPERFVVPDEPPIIVDEVA